MADKHDSGAHDDELDVFADALESLAYMLRTGACHMTGTQLASIVDLVSRLTSPSNVLTSYMVCRELGGITTRTLYNWVDAGYIPKPFQLAGGGNTHFWYSDDIERAKERIKKLRLI